MHGLPTKFYIQKIKNIFWHLPKSIFANIRYGFPSRKLILIGITGTDGKTTTATLIHQILLKAGFKSDYITTINSPGLHTTSPDPLVLQKLFAQMVQRGITHCVVETTAHGLDQFRFFGCRFYSSVITNLSHEHLDDFYYMEEYLAAKANLFSMSKNVILNRDDQSYSPLKIRFPKHLSYSIKNRSPFQATDIDITSKKMSFKVGDDQFVTDSNFEYQIYNILAALAVSSTLNISPAIVAKTIKKFPETKGRREIVANDLKFNTIVDFAHTPEALKQTLISLRKITSGKIICIFGATGGRDKTKRPIMGQVVSKYSDFAIITSDDTRNEKIEDINAQIISGISNRPGFTYFDIHNRQDAFDMAVKLAVPGDTIIACGKGHETSILLGSTEYPWSETEAFRTAFRNLNS